MNIPDASNSFTTKTDTADVSRDDTSVTSAITDFSQRTLDTSSLHRHSQAHKKDTRQDFCGKDDVSVTSGVTSASQKSFESKTSSHRCKGKAGEIGLSNDFEEDFYDDDDDESYFSRNSVEQNPSVGPSIRSVTFTVPREIELSDSDGDGDDDDDSSSVSGTSYHTAGNNEAASQGSASATSAMISANVKRHNIYNTPRRRKNKSSKAKASNSSASFRPVNRSLLKDLDIAYVTNRPFVDRRGEGGVYTGHFCKYIDMPHGKGQCAYDDGSKYKGEYIYGRWSGYGKLVDADGNVYEGDFQDGQKYGFGVQKFVDGRRFEGNYVQGEIVDGQMIYEDNSVYTGCFIQERQHGSGKLVFPCGSVYTGEFQNDSFHGFGKMIWSSRGWYFGQFENGTMHGMGKQVFPDGTLRHDGEFARGKAVYSNYDEIFRDQEWKWSRLSDTKSKEIEPRNAVTKSVINAGALQKKIAQDITVQSLLECIMEEDHDPEHHARLDAERLRPSTKRFVSTLREYLFCRLRMETEFLTDKALRSIAAIQPKTNSGGIEVPNGNPEDYKAEYQQQSIHGVPVRSLDELYEAAETTFPVFEELMHDIASKVSESSQDLLGDEAPLPSVVCALKGRDRAQEKATDEYSKRQPGPSVSWLYDITRASIECHSARQVSRCIEMLLEDDKFFVVKAKNRFKEPTLTGYRDFSVWIQLESQDGFKHICEIQVHYAPIKKLDSDLKTHSIYEFFRSYFGGATGSLADRLDDLEMICKGHDLKDFSFDKFVNDCDDEERLERLAILFHEQLSEFDLALDAYQKLFEIRESLYGPNHVAIAKTYDSQASVYRDMGDLDRAMKLYKECTRLYARRSDISLASTYQNIAIIKAEQGRTAEALKDYQTVLRILKGTSDADDMAFADVFNNMGNAECDLGKLEDALELYQKSLRLKQRYLGWEHSSVSTTYNNIGLVRLKQGRPAEAESCFLNALNIDQRTVGAEHASTTVTKGNLGLAYEQQKRFDEAKSIYHEVLNEQRAILGENHMDVASTCENLGRLHMNENEVDMGIHYLEISLRIKTASLGRKHPETTAASQSLKKAHRRAKQVGLHLDPTSVRTNRAKVEVERKGNSAEFDLAIHSA